MKSRTIAPLWILLASCGQFIESEPKLPPVIAYESPLTFSVGVAAFQPVNSTGGPVTTFSIAPPLPSGLELDATTGTVGGVALTGSTQASYTVIASGPGGADTATFLLSVTVPPLESGTPRPQIAYATPVTDTAGKTAAHAVISTGGPITGFSVSPPLPPGLKLNAASGSISGTPTVPAAATSYSVIAYGPGGRDTAAITITVIANPTIAPPKIAYASPVSDTVGRFVSHPVISTGGPVMRYRLLTRNIPSLPKPTILAPSPNELPPGLKLDSSTGHISGTPIWSMEAVTYSIIASGPGGSDTAIINITVVDTGLVSRPGPDFTGIQLSVTLYPFSSSVHLNKTGFGKRSAADLSKMIVMLASNLKDTIRDTIRSGSPGFSANSTDSRTIAKTYELKPLRWWKASVQVYDVLDSITYSGTTDSVAVPGGQIKSIALELSSRFLYYRANVSYTGTVGGGAYPFVYTARVKRMVLTVAGDTAQDTSAANGGDFAPAPAIHQLEYDYLRLDVPVAMKIDLYGTAVIPGGTDTTIRLLYSGNFIPASPAVSLPTVSLNWVGPSLGTPIP